jgi:hypothetical protein
MAGSTRGQDGISNPGMKGSLVAWRRANRVCSRNGFSNMGNIGSSVAWRRQNRGERNKNQGMRHEAGQCKYLHENFDSEVEVSGIFRRIACMIRYQESQQDGGRK